MIADLKPYPEYKESGLPWAGLMPTHWSQRRMKFLFTERVQKGFSDEPLLAATQTKGVVRKEDYGSRTVTAQKDFHLLKLVEQGDFVISLRSFEGGIEAAHCRGIISPAYTVLAPRPEAHRTYFTRFFKSPDFIRSLSLFVTGIREGQNIDYERLSRAYMPLPPTEEQKMIGRFLDHANRRLERTIRAKKKLIALLNEQKQVIIQRAVTRGLDPTVPLKPSGISWLGDIPKHWEVKRLKWVTRLQRGYDLPADKRKWGTIPVVSSGGVIDSHNESRAKGPGVVMGRYGSTDAVFYIEKDFWPHNTALFVTDFQGNLPKWCYYLLRTISKSDYSGKSAVPGVDRKDLYGIYVPRPPTTEQSTLVEGIEEQSKAFDDTIGRVEREIALLREYRTRLTADVVTGKLDVREAAARLPKETEEQKPLDESNVLTDAQKDEADDLEAVAEEIEA
ncbi:MAG: restriction endonuclease subunit S [Candidatus Manganitrophus sp.]|nr:restriction endonuclease subunit S [Candidatus Manganitrophus sp.]WDT71331.1 MAG: restriction endonuclease subunit S [Candidatus Manganitrophus sp.]